MVVCRYFRAAKCCNILHKPKYAVMMAERGLKHDKANKPLAGNTCSPDWDWFLKTRPSAVQMVLV